jgi:hypothetical protein
MVHGVVGIGLIGLGVVILVTGGADRNAGWVPLGIGAFFLLLSGFGRLAKAGAESILTTGPAGTCEILGLRETGVYVNERPRMELQVRITRPDGTIVETEETQTIGHDMLGRLHPGAVLPIRFAPDDFDIWLFDPNAPGRPPVRPDAAGGLVDELERLAELHGSGALSDEEFQAAKRRLLG